MSESTYSLFQKGRAHLKRGMPAQATVARFAPPRSAREAARELRRSLRGVRRNVRRELSGWERARGLLSLRSLGLS